MKALRWHPLSDPYLIQQRRKSKQAMSVPVIGEADASDRLQLQRALPSLPLQAQILGLRDLGSGHIAFDEVPAVDGGRIAMGGRQIDPHIGQQLVARHALTAAI